MNRRSFLSVSALASSGLLSVPLRAAQVTRRSPTAINKRDRMLRWLAGETDPHYTPAAFFLHFGANEKSGDAATRKHLQFFRQTGMDFVKIQFEQTYDRQDWLTRPADWSKLKLEKINFYEPLLVTVRGLVKEEKKNALILMTLYSPFMSAGQCAGPELLKRHLEEDPEAVKRGLEILSESQMVFVKACIDAGVDGFYMSTQGSEASRYGGSEIFTKYIKPFDLVAMREAQRRLPFNILHVCDYVAPYASFEDTKDYPGHVVNCNPKLTNRTLTWQDVREYFGRPVMGGLDRHGLLASGSEQALDEEVRRTIRSAPRQFILGADCTVASETDWSRLRRAISIAHSEPA
ncbi:MAG: hypothetical protein LC114_09475 [Bryobacterales bacterium]|nr:hypothetical protein [Bryobacterales bacterium]